MVPSERSLSIFPRILLLLACFGLWQSNAYGASNSGITYHGRILKRDGSPLQSTSVQFKLQIRTPGSENCLMYEEVQTKDMRNSSGIFAVTMNDGSGIRTDASGLTLDGVFANRGSHSFSPSACTAGTLYNTSPSDGRSMAVYFKDENMLDWEAFPQQAINFVPAAIEAKQIGGFGPQNLLRVDDSAASQNSTPFNLAQVIELKALLGGTSSQYMKASPNGSAALPVVVGAPSGTPAAGSVWYDSSTGKIKYSDGTATPIVLQAAGGGGSVTSITVGSGLVDGTGATGTSITSSGTIALPNVGTAGSYYKVTTDAQGRVASGATALVENDIPTLSTAGKVSGSAVTSGTIAGTTAFNTSGSITTTGSITGSTITGGTVASTTATTRTLQVFDNDTNKVTLRTPSDIAGDYSLILPATLPGSSGQVLAVDTSGNLSWITPSSGSVTSVSGAAPITITGTTAAPIVNISTATTGAAGVVQLSANGGTTAGQAVQASDSRLNDSRAPSGSASGDLSGTYPSPTVAKIQGTSVSSSIPLDAQLMRFTGGGSNQWAPANVGLSDLRTSTGGQQFSNATCTAAQTLTWSAITDVVSCTNIAISNAQVSGLGSASTLNAGTAANNLVQLDTGAKIPASLIPTSVATQWTTSGSNIYYNTGNVGIGTNNPSSTFEVAGNITAPIIRPPAATSFSVQTQSTSPGVGSMYVRDSQGYPNLEIAPIGDRTNRSWIRIDGGTDTQMPHIGSFSNAGNPGLALGPTTSQSLVIDSTGNVGIGTINPNYKLDVAGDTNSINIWIANNNSGSAGTVGYQSGANGPAIQFWGSSSANSGKMLFTTNSGTRMTLDSTGNVGIGTTSPSSMLQVTGGIQIGSDADACAANKSGTLRYNSGNVEYCNGTAWAAFGVSGDGITSFNGSSASTQSFASAISGTAPGWSTNTGSGVHTLNVPMASTVGTTAGLISKSDYDSFSGKQPSGNYVTGLTGDVTAAGPGSVAATISANAVTTGKINDKAVTFAKVQDINTNRLIGRSTASVGVMEEISLGTGLTLSAGVLNANAGTVTSVSSTNSYLSVATGTSTPALTLNVGTAANTVAAGDDSRITGALQKAGGTMSGAVNMGGFDVTNAGNISLAASKNLQLGNFATDPSTAGWTAADKGKTWFNTTSNQIKFYDGSSVQVVGTGSGTVSSVTASAPLASSGGTTPNISISQATTSTNGYLSSADWNTFNSKIGTVAGSPLTSGNIWVGNGSNLAASVTPTGDVAMNNAGVMSVNAIKGKTVSAAPTLAGQVIRYDGTDLTPGFIAMTDLRSSVTGTSSFATSCTASQTLVYNSIGDIMSCANIAISNTQVSGLGSAATLAAGTAANNLVQLDGGAKIPASLIPNSVITQWTTSGSNIYYNTGKVGIGTTSPVYTLDARTSSNLLGNFTTSATYGMFEIGSEGYTGLKINGIVNGTASHLMFNLSRGSQAAPTNVVSGDNLGMLRFRGNDKEAAYIGVYADGAPGVGYTPGRLVFSTSNSSAGYERMRIDSNGYVGIGTPSPTDILTVDSGATRGRIVLNSDGDASAYGDIRQRVKTTGGIAAGKPYQWSWSLRKDGAYSGDSSGPTLELYADKMGGGTLAPLLFKTNGDVVLAGAGNGATNGNVGIGTSSPAQTLDVSGVARARGFEIGGVGSFPRTYQLSMMNPGSIESARIEGYATGSGGSSEIRFYTSMASSLNQKMVIDNIGNVGIGVASPTSLLQVAGGVQIGTDAAACDGTKAGTIRYNSTNVEFCNGSAWTAFSTGSGSVSSVTASAPLSSSGGTNPNISISQATSTSNGYLSSTDWSTFNNKLDSITGSTLASGNIWIGNGSNLAAAVAPSGDVAINNSGVMTVNALKGKAVSAAPTLPGQLLRYDGTNFTPAFMAMTDLRSSVTGTNSFATSCTASQTLTYNSVGDLMSCSNIAISNTQVSGLGSAATLNAGTSAANLVQLDGTARIPASLIPASAATQWTTAGSKIHYSSGNVGIGVNDPLYSLDVEGEIRSNNRLTVLEASPSVNKISLGSAGGSYSSAPAMANTHGFINFNNANNWSSYIAVDNNAADLMFLNGGNQNAVSERMRITSGGNVGIGTTTPSEKLHVTANVKVDGQILAANGSVTNPGLAFANSPGSGLYLFGSTLRIANAGVEMAGFNGSGMWGGSGSSFRPYINLTGSGSATAPTYSFYNDTNTGMFSSVADNLQFTTAGAERLRIDSAGNVGIGTATPSQKLDVLTPGYLSTRFKSSGSSDPSMILTIEGADVGDGRAALYLNYPGTAGSMIAQDATNMQFFPTSNINGTPAMVITNTSSNVGIGTSTPQYKLDVLSYNINVGADWATGTARTDATGKGGYVTFPHYLNAQVPITMIGSLNSATGNTVSVGGGTTSYNAATNILFYTATNNTTVAGTERMRINNNGNVGIGTTSPTSLLQIAGGLQIGADAATCAAGKAGTMRYNSGNIEFCNGTIWAAFGVSGSAVTSFNGSTVSSQSLATPGVAGLAPNWSTNTGSGVHTLNIPLASGISVTAGLLSKTDYDFFAGKQAAGNYVTGLTGDVTATGPGSVAATISANAVTTSKINNSAVTYAKIQNVSTNNRLLGRSTAGAGVMEEISLGTGLTLSGGVLTGSSGTVSSVSSTNSYLSVATGTTTPALTLNVGAVANTVAAGDDSRITGALQKVGGTMTGALNMGGFNITNVGSLTGASALTLAAGGTNQNVTLTPSGTGATLLNGNVGIGITPATDTPLYVYKSSTGISRIINHNSATGASVSARYDLATGTANSYSLTTLVDNSGAPYLINNVGSAVTGTFYDSPVHAFRSQAGVERMRVHSDGRIGIGTAAPAGILDVRGGTIAAGSASSINIYAQNGQAGVGNGGNINLVPGTGLNNGFVRVTGNTNITGNLYMDAGAATQVLLSTTSNSYLLAGNMGIGTNAPATKLDVNGNIRTNSSFQLANATQNWIVTPGANFTIATTDSTFGVSTNRLRLSSTGQATLSAVYAGSGTAANPALVTSNTGINDTGLYSPNSNEIGISLAGVERVRVLAGGNVGIGTTTPAQLLSVAGTIESTSGGFKFPDGTTQTTAGTATYQLSCTSYSTVGSSCVRIDASTGATNCKFNGNPISGGSWNACVGGNPFTATTASQYSIACNPYNGVGLTCTRLNLATGASYCRANTNVASGGSWNDCVGGNPF